MQSEEVSDWGQEMPSPAHNGLLRLNPSPNNSASGNSSESEMSVGKFLAK